MPAATHRTGNSYQFLDSNPVNGANYYRLRQEDDDGTTTYSGVRMVNFRAQVVTIFPNPASDVAFIQWPEAVVNVEEFIFTDVRGAITTARVNLTGNRINIAGDNLHLPTQWAGQWSRGAGTVFGQALRRRNLLV